MNHNLKLELTKEILNASEFLQECSWIYPDLKGLIEEYSYGEKSKTELFNHYCDNFASDTDFGTASLQMLKEGNSRNHFLEVCRSIFEAEPLFASVASDNKILVSENLDWISYINLGYTSAHFMLFIHMNSLLVIWDQCLDPTDPDFSNDTRSIISKELRDLKTQVLYSNQRSIIGGIRSEYMKLIAKYGYPDNYKPTKQDGFDTAMLTFTEGKSTIHFDSAKMQFKLFKYIYTKQTASFDDLRKHVWERNTEDQNIISCYKRVNERIAKAGSLDRYELRLKNGHVILTSSSQTTS